MKAITLRQPAGLDKFHLVDLPDPGQPDAGEVRVHVHASSLSFHDLGVVTGHIPSADGRVPMFDGAGVVEAAGEGVGEFAVGDSVVSTSFPTWLDGGSTLSDFATVPSDGVDSYARECVVRPAHWFTHTPRGYSHAETVTLTTAGLTVRWALVVDARLKAGDTVLVLGTGGVSIFALQFVESMGATAIATSSSDDKLARAQALGADFTINYRRDTDWTAKVLEYTNGRGADSVIGVGGPDTLGQSIQACRTGGHTALIGVLTGIAGSVPTVELIRRHQTLQDLIVGSRRHQRDMVRAIDATGIKSVIDQTFALEDIADAFMHQVAGEHFGRFCPST